MKKVRIIIIILLCLIFVSLNNYSTPIHIMKEIEKTMTIENIEEELIQQGINHVDIVLNQVKLETGHLKFVKNNNLFGFHNGKSYLKFDTWQDAVIYKKQWQDRKYKGGDYYKFLKNVGYAKDSNYINKLKQM